MITGGLRVLNVGLPVIVEGVPPQDVVQLDWRPPAFGDAEATRNDGGADHTRQRGLVNIAVTDLNVQVPVGVAANICGVSANVISSAALTGPVDCEALGEGNANG